MELPRVGRRRRIGGIFGLYNSFAKDMALMESDRGKEEIFWQECWGKEWRIYV